MTNLDSILKSRDITFPTKVRLVKATVFPVVMCGFECWTRGVCRVGRGLSLAEREDSGTGWQDVEADEMTVQGFSSVLSVLLLRLLLSCSCYY